MVAKKSTQSDPSTEGPTMIDEAPYDVVGQGLDAGPDRVRAGRAAAGSAPAVGSLIERVVADPVSALETPAVAHQWQQGFPDQLRHHGSG